MNSLAFLANRLYFLQHTKTSNDLSTPGIKEILVGLLSNLEYTKRNCLAFSACSIVVATVGFSTGRAREALESMSYRPEPPS